MRDRPAKQDGGEHGRNPRLVALAAEAVVFALLIPLAFVGLGSALDGWLGLQPPLTTPLNVALGWLLVLMGGALVLWVTHAQFTRGLGTPGPVLSTQRLVTDGPYCYCRNPMTVGIIAFYKGVAVLAGSVGVAAVVALFLIALLVYLYLVEEPALAARFGAEYEDYRRRTAFLVPGVW